MSADPQKKTDDYAIELDNSPLPNAKSYAPPSSNFSGALPILSYCGSSILMTVANKYVLSGLNFNMNFLLLAVQVRRHCFFLGRIKAVVALS